jgi:hypothetical protein
MSAISVIEFLVVQRRIVFGLMTMCCALALGQHIPATGFLLNELDIQYQEQLGHISIFSGGFASWFVSWALLQLFLLVKYWWPSQSMTAPQLANPFDPRVVWLTLILSSFTWFSLLGNVVPIYTQIPLTTPQFLVGMTSGLAGVSILFFLGQLINRRVPGFGFWGLIVLSNLYGFGISFYSEIQFLLQGEMSRTVAAISILLLLLCLASAVVLAGKCSESSSLPAPAIFASILLSEVVALWLTPLIYLALEPVLLQWAAYLPEIVVHQAFRIVANLLKIVCALVFLALLASRNRRLVWRWDKAPFLVVLLVAGEINAFAGGLMWSDVSPLSWLIVAWASSKAWKAYSDYRGPVAVSTTTDDDHFDEDFRRGWRR